MYADEGVGGGQMPDIGNREIDRLERAMSELGNRFERSIEHLTLTLTTFQSDVDQKYVRKELFDSKIETIEATQEKHGGYWDWVVRTIFGAIILAAATALIATNGGKW